MVFGRIAVIYRSFGNASRRRLGGRLNDRCSRVEAIDVVVGNAGEADAIVRKVILVHFEIAVDFTNRNRPPFLSRTFRSF